MKKLVVFLIMVAAILTYDVVQSERGASKTVE